MHSLVFFTLDQTVIPPEVVFVNAKGLEINFPVSAVSAPKSEV